MVAESRQHGADPYDGQVPYLTHPDRLGELLPGEPPFRVRQLRRWLYRTPVLDAADMTNLPAAVRHELRPGLWPFVVELERGADEGGTRKWLFRASDGAAIEAVLIGYPRRATLCISTQAGCALACAFCATGQFGFERHLDPGRGWGDAARYPWQGHRRRLGTAENHQPGILTSEPSTLEWTIPGR